MIKTAAAVAVADVADVVHVHHVQTAKEVVSENYIKRIALIDQRSSL